MSKQKDIMKDVAYYRSYVLNKLIESTEVVYSPKLDYSDSWFHVEYPFNPKDPVYMGETFSHPFSYIKFEYHVQENYGILDNEVTVLWQDYKKYINDLCKEIERKGPNDSDLIT